MYNRSSHERYLQGIEIKFGNRHIDTNSIGFGVYQTYNSDDLFELVGCAKRNKHNALDDARNVVRTIQVTRSLANECFGG